MRSFAARNALGSRAVLALLAALILVFAAGCNYNDFQRPYARNYVMDLFYKSHSPPDPMKDVEKRQAAMAAALERWRQKWPAGEEPYLVGPDDILQVRVFPVSPEGQQVLDVIVDEQGAIQLPLVGKVDVDGHTVAEIEEQVRNLYAADYYRDPVVSIAVAQFRSKRIYVTGAVGQPGTLMISENRIPLLEALLMAGATRVDAADEMIVTRKAEGADAALEAVAGPNAGLPTPTEAADSVTPAGVESEPVEMSVGASDEAGPDRQAAGADAAVEGPPADSAGVASVRVSIQGLIDGTEPEENVWVYPGDIVHVPVRPVDTVTVVGYVNRPGIYPLPVDRKLTLLDAVMLAGGPSWSARTEKTRLVRETDSGPKTYKIDLTRVASAKDPDIQVVADDTIIVTTSWLMRVADGILYAFRFGRAIAYTGAGGY